MANFLVLTTDLPYFPGKHGVDFFNLRHLAKTHCVAVVAPRYESCPAAGVGNLAKAVTELYLWPDQAPPTHLFIGAHVTGALPRWIQLLPASLRRSWLKRQLGIPGQPDDAFERLAILANCAPNLLAALHHRPWQGIILIQSSLAPWLAFLPRMGAKVFYFHDVRSDYLARSTESLARKTVRQVHRQEQFAATEAEAVGFVSALDLQRAENILHLPEARMVSPIPIDTDYYVPPPDDWRKDPRQIVLFTGHLRHPPNVDAVVYFLETVWPLVQQHLPDAVFQVVGLTPHPRVEAAVARARNAELHANVPDIRPYFWNANAYVVPMRYGGGVRQKILEAWAMRVPTVCTHMAVEGIDAESGINCWLVDAPDAMAGKLAEILRADPPVAVIDRAVDQVARVHTTAAASGEFEKLARLGPSQRRQRPYKLLYDLRWMKIGASGGTEQMSHELIHAISRLDHRNSYRAYVPRSTFYDWELDPAFDLQPHFCDPGETRAEGLTAAFVNHVAGSLALPPVLTPEMRSLRTWRKLDFDLVHSMLGYTHPDLACFPCVLTAHDLQHLYYPEFFTPEEWTVRDRLYRESAAKALHVICVSEYTRQDMHRHYQVPLEKMTTIWNIPSHQVWRPPAPALTRSLLADMGVQEPYLYYPGHCWTHKNHTRLVEAFDLIQTHIPKDLHLVFSGRPFPENHPALALIKTHGLDRRIKHLGYRSPLEVRTLLHGCQALVFPSLFEGFGIPVMDAIIAGKPVVCSNRTSLPEIAGDAALTFDPTNIHDIGGRLLEVINDPDRRTALVAATVRRRPLFSARLGAIRTLAVYRQVHEQFFNS
jgi:glycosyltransferase involved in cell wall biosynthesis